MTTSRALTRALSGAGITAGAILLLRPDAVLGRIAPEYPRERRWVARVLGARLAAQHAAVLVAPTPAVLRAAGATDLLHAATMLPLLRSPQYGSAARVSGGLAAAYGVLTIRAARA